ncbi:MAG: sigma-54-dependent transcriptional regulator [Myxococcota bacterium]
MSRRRSVLVVDDEEGVRRTLAIILDEGGYDVRAVADGTAALKEIERSDFEVVVTDVRMPGVGGLELLERVRETSPETTVIVMSAYGNQDTAIEAVKRGAYDFISKPFKPDEMVLLLRKAEEREALRSENRRLRAELAARGAGGGLDSLIGDSAPMEAVRKKIVRLAEYKTTVLLSGESGTGKELVARAIHGLSQRSERPFVAVNCGAIPEALMESELFGHVRGAFTDAHSTRRGLVEEAEGGTLFLDEVGELPTALQVKLLRFLQEEEIRPVGGSRNLPVDVRVVAATARELQQEVEEGRFREDLFYRLNVIPLHLPPLRERPGDVPKLVRHFLERLGERLGKRVKGVSEEAMAVLESSHWTGNVRELENMLERVLVLCDGETIEVSDLPERFRSAKRSLPELPSGSLSLKKTIPLLEAEIIRRALEETGGNRTRAAELLEISHRALLYKMKAYGIS